MKECLKKFKNEVFLVCGENKGFLIFLMSFFLLGIIIGIIALVNYREVITVFNLNDKTLLLYLKKDISLFSFFLKRLFSVILIFLLIMLLNCNKFLSFFNFLLFVFLGYFFVINIGIIIINFGFFGVIFSLLINFLFGIIYSLLMVMFILFSRNCCNCFGNYFNNIKNSYLLFIILLIILLVVCLLEMILAPILSSAFIIIH